MFGQYMLECCFNLLLSLTTMMYVVSKEFKSRQKELRACFCNIKALLKNFQSNVTKIEVSQKAVLPAFQMKINLLSLLFRNK